MVKHHLNVTYRYSDDIDGVVTRINKRLVQYGVEIHLVYRSELKEKPAYDDMRVYFTGERARDSRIDGTIMRADRHAA